MSRGECPPEQMEVCPLTIHFKDVHHLYFPRRDYNNRVEKEYRELPPHKVEMCRNEHNELHATEQPPTKPPRSEMLRAIASYATKEAAYESEMDGS